MAVKDGKEARVGASQALLHHKRILHTTAVELCPELLVLDTAVKHCRILLRMAIHVKCHFLRECERVPDSVWFCREDQPPLETSMRTPS